jgi:uncharacterized protein (TIGR02271 family)
MTTKVSQQYDWQGRELVDNDGQKIGTIEGLYCDTSTSRPEWAAVRTGLLGTKLNFVPITDAQPTGEQLQVPFDKDQVKNAPSIDPEGQLTEQEEAELYSHYAMSYSERSDQGDRTEADDAMTRSEEELHVGTEQQPAGRARLRKWVETELVEQTVPVRREKARIEREPITDANRDEALSGPEISDSEHEVTLHEEEPVVEKRTVPKERVRLDKDVETDEREVSEEVRKERIEAEGDVR